jgi:hypothetical protein
MLSSFKDSLSDSQRDGNERVVDDIDHSRESWARFAFRALYSTTNLNYVLANLHAVMNVDTGIAILSTLWIYLEKDVFSTISINNHSTILQTMDPLKRSLLQIRNAIKSCSSLRSSRSAIRANVSKIRFQIWFFCDYTANVVITKVFSIPIIICKSQKFSGLLYKSEDIFQRRFVFPQPLSIFQF